MHSLGISFFGLCEFFGLFPTQWVGFLFAASSSYSTLKWLDIVSTSLVISALWRFPSLTADFREEFSLLAFSSTIPNFAIPIFTGWQLARSCLLCSSSCCTLYHSHAPSICPRPSCRRSKGLAHAPSIRLPCCRCIPPPVLLRRGGGVPPSRESGTAAARGSPLTSPGPKVTSTRFRAGSDNYVF